MPRSKKENLIILPNKDKISAGKIKDVSKYLSMISAEYGIDQDIAYFTVEKEKHTNIFKLQFIPIKVAELHSETAKKFVLYELVRMGHRSVMQFDEELSQRAVAIYDLLNTIEDANKETVTSRLEIILGNRGQLDHLLDMLLTDPQFNCFKYTVLNQAKAGCLLCVTGSGLFMRSIEAPFGVLWQLAWEEIAGIKTKSNRLTFQKTNGQSESIVCVSKKTSKAAGSHLARYLDFLGRKEAAAHAQDKRSWFGSIALRIRQSFTRRPAGQSKGALTLGRRVLDVADGGPEDGQQATIAATAADPSIKTNSTHDVSLGSANSYVPSVAPSEPPQPQTMRPYGQDDHFSVKTTSTYEVSLDSGPSLKALPNGGKGDHDPSGQDLISDLPPLQARRSPPLSHLKGNLLFSGSSDGGDGVPLPTDKSPETRGLASPPLKTPTSQCEPQPALQPPSHHPTLKTLPSQLPETPDRSSDISNASDQSKEEASTFTSRNSSAIIGTTPEFIRSEDPMVLPSGDPPPDYSSGCAPIPVVESPPTRVLEDSQRVSTFNVDDPNLGDNPSVPSGPASFPTKEESAPQNKSLPSPKISRPNRILSMSSSKERQATTPSPTSTSTQAAQSPSDKENYNSIVDRMDLHQQKHQEFDDNINNLNVNFSRFENEEYTVDSKTTITSVSTVGDCITKKSVKTEISTVKASGIPAPKQYKTTTTITSTVKKPSDAQKSPPVSGQKSSGIPRMASK